MKANRLKKTIKTAKAWAKVHLKEPIINNATGFPIEVSCKGLDHSLIHDLIVDKSGRFVDLLSLVRKFKTILRDADFGNTEFNKHTDNDVKFHKFYYQTKIKECSETLEIVVKEVIEGKKVMIKKWLFYNHRFDIEDIKKPNK